MPGSNITPQLTEVTIHKALDHAGTLALLPVSQTQQDSSELPVEERLRLINQKLDLYDTYSQYLLTILNEDYAGNPFPAPIGAYGGYGNQHNQDSYHMWVNHHHHSHSSGGGSNDCPPEILGLICLAVIVLADIAAIVGSVYMVKTGIENYNNALITDAKISRQARRLGKIEITRKQANRLNGCIDELTSALKSLGNAKKNKAIIELTAKVPAGIGIIGITHVFFSFIAAVWLSSRLNENEQEQNSLFQFFVTCANPAAFLAFLTVLAGSGLMYLISYFYGISVTKESARRCKLEMAPLGVELQLLQLEASRQAIKAYVKANEFNKAIDVAYNMKAKRGNQSTSSVSYTYRSRCMSTLPSAKEVKHSEEDALHLEAITFIIKTVSLFKSKDTEKKHTLNYTTPELELLDYLQNEMVASQAIGKEQVALNQAVERALLMTDRDDRVKYLIHIAEFYRTKLNDIESAKQIYLEAIIKARLMSSHKNGVESLIRLVNKASEVFGEKPGVWWEEVETYCSSVENDPAKSIADTIVAMTNLTVAKVRNAKTKKRENNFSLREQRDSELTFAKDTLKRVFNLIDKNVTESTEKAKLFAFVDLAMKEVYVYDYRKLETTVRYITELSPAKKQPAYDAVCKYLMNHGYDVDLWTFTSAKGEMGINQSGHSYRF